MELEIEDRKDQERERQKNEDLDSKILVENAEANQVKEILENNGIQYDIDSYDRVLVSESNEDKVIDLLEEAGFEAYVEIEEERGDEPARILIDERTFNTEDFDLVEEIFDKNGIEYNFDSGDRIMIPPEDVDRAIVLLEEAGISADIV